MTLLHSPGMRRQLGGHGRGVGGSEAEDEKGGGGGEVGGKRNLPSWSNGNEPRSGL